MKIEITDYSQLEGYGNWFNERITFRMFEQEENQIIEIMCKIEEAKELAQELKHAYNKLMHWIDKQEDREE